MLHQHFTFKRTTFSNFAVSAGGDWLALVEAAAVSILDLTSGDTVAAFDLPNPVFAAIRRLALSPDGRWLVIGGGQQAHEYGLIKGIGTETPPRAIQLNTDPAESQWVSTLAINSDSTRLATGHLNHVGIWTLPDLNLQTLLQTNTGWVSSLHFLPDDTRLLAAGNYQPSVWDLTAHRIEHMLPPQPEMITRSSLSADGRWLAYGLGSNYHAFQAREDGTEHKTQVTIWDTTRWEQIGLHHTESSAIPNVAFVGDVPVLITSAYQQDVPWTKIWSIPDLQLLEEHPGIGISAGAGHYLIDNQGGVWRYAP